MYIFFLLSLLLPFLLFLSEQIQTFSICQIEEQLLLTLFCGFAMLQSGKLLIIELTQPQKTLVWCFPPTPSLVPVNLLLMCCTG